MQIYEAAQFQILKKFFIDDEVMKIKWSPDDKFIMSINTKSGTIHLREVINEAVDGQTEDWKGVIEEEMLAGACWSADSRQVITFTDL